MSIQVFAYVDPNGGGGIGPVEVFVILAIYILPSVLVARYAANKGHSFAVFLIVSLLFSWLIALIIAVVMQDKTKQVAQGSHDHLDSLQKITELRDAGTLSPDEFEAEKARILRDSR